MSNSFIEISSEVKKEGENTSAAKAARSVRRHARYALEMKAYKIINIKPARVGGLSQAIAIHDHCLAQQIPVWCGGMLERELDAPRISRSVSLPGFVLPGDISASDRYYHRDITHERFVLNDDSTITVPTGHGLGVTMDESALKEFSLAEITLKA